MTFNSFPIPTKPGFESLLVEKAQDVATDANRAETARDDAQGVLPDRLRRDVPTLLADTALTYTADQPGTVTAGDIIRTRAENSSFRVTPAGQNSRAAFTAGGIGIERLPNAIASGTLPLLDAVLDERSTAQVRPIASRLNDGFIYGVQGDRLYRSADEGAMWTAYGPTLSGGVVPSLLLPAGDGEILAVFSSTIRKSSNWPDGAFTLGTVLTNPTATAFREWGADSGPESGLAIVTHYAAGGLSAFEESRYVWLSQDNGDTWSIIRDLADDGINDRHLHFAAIDPWNNNRLWINHHNFDSQTGTGKSIEYSDDLGATWQEADIDIVWQAGADNDLTVPYQVQPTVAVATPHGLVLGSDDVFSGLLIIRHGSEQVEILAEGPKEDFTRTIRSFANYGQRDPITGIVYVVYNQQTEVGKPFIMATDGRVGSLVWEEDPLPILTSGDVLGLPGFRSFALTPDKIIATMRRPASDDATTQKNWLLTASKPALGYVPPIDRGQLLGGQVGRGNTRSVAVGLGSFAGGAGSVVAGWNARFTGSDFGVVIGPDAVSAHNQTVVIGGGAESGGSQSVTIGELSIAPPSGVIIGYNSTYAASGNGGIGIGNGLTTRSTSIVIGNNGVMGTGTGGVGVGHNVTTANNGTAVGSNSTSLGDGVAIGRETSAGSNGIAIGRGAATTGTGGTAVGRNSSAVGTATAFGENAVGGHTGSIALGSATSAANQLAIGGRHIEFDLMTAPGAPGDNKARLFLRENAGVKELCVRFPTGAIQVISQEPS